MIQHTLRISGIILLLLTGTLLPADNLQAQAAGETHEVQGGETLFSISRLYDVTVGDLRRWNNLESDNLRSGQEILIGPPQTEESVIHTVEAGETLFAISRRYGVTTAEIQSWNNLPDVQLSRGQELTIFTDQNDNRDEPQQIPTEVEEDTPPRESIVRDQESNQGTTYYTVRSGDTLTRIARLHDMTVAQLRDLNSLQSDQIRVGQRLTVRDVQTAPSIAEGAEESTPQGRFVSYRLESGEDTGDLLDAFMMTEQELAALNPDLNIASLSSGQRVTVLLPPSRNFPNPFSKNAQLENLGEVPVARYSDENRSEPTTSGELYNPDYLTAGHSNMPMGNVVFIENPDNNRGIYVRINDRTSGSGIKLSHKAYEMLGFATLQQAKVRVYLDQ